MEDRESSGPSPFNSLYHKVYNSNSNPTPTNAIFTASQRAVVGPESTRNASSTTQPITIATAPNASPPLYSECPTPFFAHPLNGIGGVGVARSETFKRKRGRPRKYGIDVDGFGNMGLGLSPLSSPSFSDKRGRGSGKKAQMAALGSVGQRFTPHVITIAAGEDVYNKIVLFMQHGPWAVCVLCANGAISNATLRQTGMSGGTVTYEGRFEILSLSGSFLLTEVGGTQAKTGGLSVSLAGQDGNVVGGGVGGLLVAASPVQVVVGTFLVGRKNNLGWVGNIEPSIGTLLAPMSGGSPSPSPVAVLSRTETSGGTSTSKGGHGERNPAGSSYNTQPQVLNMTSLQSMNWAGSHFEAETKSDTDTTLTGRTKPRDQDDGSRSYKDDEEEEHKDQNITFDD